MQYQDLETLLRDLARDAMSLDSEIKLAMNERRWKHAANLMALQIGVVDAIRKYREGKELESKDIG